MGRPEVHEYFDKVDLIELRCSAVTIDRINRNEKWDKYKKKMK